ncbi:transposase [Streptomyces sp. DvalAA-14]|uniref:transposase n=1 Tax=unclassified Streptomyces TaxID=2593676 RepID=UPI00081B9960|nr:transposase [Streptomyces sp. DvalAA-14]MYS19951.1 transposase [Streptomyces sp. SID4948]SCD57199.1 transposase [Streptomyces sp. DvalAA-14]
MAKRKNYPEEFKRDAVDLVHSSKDRTLTDIAHGSGIHLETLRKWVHDDKARVRAADGGGDAGMTPDEKEELKRLRRENARLKEDNEILRKAALDSTGQSNSAG